MLALGRYRGVLGVAFAFLLWQVAHQVYTSTWAFYTIAKFAWSPASLAYAGVFMALTQALLSGKAVKAFGERSTAYIGMAFGMIGFTAYAFATKAWMLYPIMTLAALQGFTYPSMNAILSQKVAREEQGELQGGVGSLYSLSSIAGPFLMTQALAHFTEEGVSPYFPGAAFLLAALLALSSLLVFSLGLASRREER